MYIYKIQEEGRTYIAIHDTEPVFVKLLRSPGIDSQPGGRESITLFDVPPRQAT